MALINNSKEQFPRGTYSQCHLVHQKAYVEEARASEVSAEVRLSLIGSYLMGFKPKIQLAKAVRGKYKTSIIWYRYQRQPKIRMLLVLRKSEAGG